MTCKDKHLTIAIFSIIIILVTLCAWFYIELGHDFVDRDRLIVRIVCPITITISCCVIAYVGAVNKTDDDYDVEKYYNEEESVIPSDEIENNVSNDTTT